MGPSGARVVGVRGGRPLFCVPCHSVRLGRACRSRDDRVSWDEERGLWGRARGP